MHFKPADGYVGDLIPFYWNGEYHAFYLERQEGRDLFWAHVLSRDLVHWIELPTALDVGEPGSPDANGCWTGSVIEHGGLFHLFYTGHNKDRSKYPPQTICHATSSGLIHWKKDSSNPIVLPDPKWYEEDDWRDPHVFWNEEEAEYWMLICARVKDAPTPRRGCVAVAKSPDLKHWTVYPPLWAPYSVYTPECPDLFRLQGRWYLIFSYLRTRYRAAESLKGPWLRYPVESFDCTPFYAAKTISDEYRRLLLGWIASKEGEQDEGNWRWGGHMATPREITAQPDGSLGVRCPEEIVEAFRKVTIQPGMPVQHEIVTGSWSTTRGSLVGELEDGFAITKLQQAPDDYFLKTTLRLNSIVTSAGFVIRASDKLASGYVLALEPFSRRVAFQYWRHPGGFLGDPQPCVEQSFDVRPGQPVECRIIVEGTILEAFFDEEISLSTRMYNHRKGQLCLFVENGQAKFDNLYLAEMV